MALIDNQLEAGIHGDFEKGWLIAQQLEKETPTCQRAAFNRGWYLLRQGKLKPNINYNRIYRSISFKNNKAVMTDYLNGSSSSQVEYSLYGVHDGNLTLVADLVGAKLDYENLKQILDNEGTGTPMDLSFELSSLPIGCVWLGLVRNEFQQHSVTKNCFPFIHPNRFGHFRQGGGHSTMGRSFQRQGLNRLGGCQYLAGHLVS